MPAITKSAVARIVARHRAGGQGALLPVLQDIQAKYNYLPARAIELVSELLPASRSRVYGVVTFYAQFSLKPRGRHLIRLCDGTACHVRGARAVRQAIEEEYALTPGATTPDGKYTLEEVACLGSCFLSPVMMLDNAYYGNLTPERAVEILRELP